MHHRIHHPRLLLLLQTQVVGHRKRKTLEMVSCFCLQHPILPINLQIVQKNARVFPSEFQDK